MKQKIVAAMLVAGALALSACGEGGSDSSAPSPTVTHFSVSAAVGSVVSGKSLGITVQALDDSNNLVANFTGTLQVSSSDANATLPGQQSLTGGTAAFSVTFNTAGNQTVSVSSGPLHGTSSAIAVSPAPLTITSGAPPSGMVGKRYDYYSGGYGQPGHPGFSLTATGGTNLTWSWSAQPGSAVPPGLSVTGHFIEGTPTHAGSYSVLVTVASSASVQTSQQYNITIANPKPPTIAAIPAPQGATLNQPYSYRFLTVGYAVTVSATGTLPAGLAPVTAAGVLAGTPTVTGSFPIVVQVVDGVGQSVTQDYAIQVFPHGFSSTGSMQTVRGAHTSTLLSSGQVLVAGGNNPTVAGPLATTEIFDPGTQVFAGAGNMTTARSDHTATLLCAVTASPCSNPKVLIAGGQDLSSTLATAELFDPVAGTFSPTGTLNEARFVHTAVLLNNGKVLIAGGAIASSPIASAELFDPSTGRFANTGSLVTGRWGHTATLLSSGKVLITGGADATGRPIASAELYDPVAGTFTASGTMQATRLYHTATQLTNGKVLIVGGSGSGGATAELYDPSSGTFAATGSPALWRMQHGAALLPDGTVLVAGGYYSPGNIDTADAELYEPQTGTFSETGGLLNARDNVVLTALGTSGRVLLTGGVSPLGVSTAAELYQ